MCSSGISIVRLKIIHGLPQWATFPLLLLAFQAGDLQGLVDNRTVGATLHGADRFEKARSSTRTASTVVSKAVAEAIGHQCDVVKPVTAITCSDTPRC